MISHPHDLDGFPLGPLSIADCHNDLLMSVIHQRERGVVDPFGAFWLPQLRAGGVRLQVLPVFTEEQFVQEAALRRCLLTIDEAHVLAETHAADVAIATTAGEIDDIIASGRIALVLAIEGAEPVGRDLAMIRVLHRAGVRLLSFTWNRRSMLADGVGEHDSGGGLTYLGRSALAEMEELGIVLDVSHLSERGFWDVTTLATKPFLASHSSSRAVHDHIRNLTDDQLRFMGESGGMVCVNAHGPFIADTPTVQDFLDHVEHILEVVGSSQVGLGLDFILDVADVTDWGSGRRDLPTHGMGLIESLLRPADLPGLADQMISRFGRTVTEGVAFGNLRDFFTKAF